MYVRMTPDIFTCLVLKNAIELFYSQFHLKCHISRKTRRNVYVFFLPIRDALPNLPSRCETLKAAHLFDACGLWHWRQNLDDLFILSDRLL